MATRRDDAVQHGLPGVLAEEAPDTRAYDGSPVELYGRTWTGEHAEIYWGFRQRHRARELIRATCPETHTGYASPTGITLAYVRAPEKPIRAAPQLFGAAE